MLGAASAGAPVQGMVTEPTDLIRGSPAAMLQSAGLWTASSTRSSYFDLKK
jgi:hypothetical protein